MRIWISIFLFVFVLPLFGQFQSGFDPLEATCAIRMCNSFNFIKQFGSDQDIVPESYNLVHTSEIMSMDNMFQVYENGQYGVINFRGSTEKMISWIENFYSAMIPANGIIKSDGETIPYSFSNNEKAAVHAGYALSTVIMANKIKEQITLLNAQGIYNIMITGHSQGGALATMTRAYLENLPTGELDKMNSYKTYVFAAPMCGNQEFATEYNELYANQGTSFSIVNPKDPIPTMPFNYEEDALVTKDKIKGWLFGADEFEAKRIGQNALFKMFEGALTKHVISSNSLINKVIAMTMGDVEMPEFVEDINYFTTGSIIEIESFEYPRVEIDVSGKTEEELNAYEQGHDGKWYYKETRFFQHKPYNYYVYTLKTWDKASYERLNTTYLISDL